MKSKLYRMMRKYTKTAAVIGLFLLLIVTTRYFIYSLKTYYNLGELHPRHHYAIRDYRDRAYTHKVIAPWMTFDYINVIFSLPPDYLKTALLITDPTYPNLRIERYAKKTNQNVNDITAKIEEDITTYNSNL